MTTTPNTKHPLKFVYKPLSKSIQEISKLLNLLKSSDQEIEGVLGLAITAAAIRMIEGIVNTIISSIPIHKELKGSMARVAMSRLHFVHKSVICKGRSFFPLTAMLIAESK